MSSDFFELRPDVQAQRLAAVGADALAEWGIQDATLRLIKYRENAVFEATHKNGRHALRMHRVGYHSDDELRSELQWMQALQESAIAVPIVVPCSSGDLFITRRGDGLPGEIQIDLFEWIDGRQLGSVEEGIADESSLQTTFQTIGEIAAKVHNQSSEWHLPAGFTRHSWDAKGLGGENPFWGKFWELESASRAEKQLMRRARDTIHRRLALLSKTPDVYSMIHADFAPENLLVDGADVRLIDFDDAGFGWHLFEIATSLYFFRGDEFYDDALNALIAGYRKNRQLSDQHLEDLPLMYLARAFTYVGWVHTRQETETAKEMTPLLLQMACETAEEYWTNYAD